MTRYRLVRGTGLTLATAAILYNFGATDFIRQAYPADLSRSAALANCAATDPSFVRFLPADRARCYARQPRLLRNLDPLADARADTTADVGSLKTVIR